MRMREFSMEYETVWSMRWYGMSMRDGMMVCVILTDLKFL